MPLLAQHDWMRPNDSNHCSLVWKNEPDIEKRAFLETSQAARSADQQSLIYVLCKNGPWRVWQIPGYVFDLTIKKSNKKVIKADLQPLDLIPHCVTVNIICFLSLH